MDVISEFKKVIILEGQKKKTGNHTNITNYSKYSEGKAQGVMKAYNGKTCCILVVRLN